MIDTIPVEKFELLLELKKNYRLFLLSNTNVIHWEHIAKHQFDYKEYTINDFFEKCYLSYELKMLKPNHEIYQYILDDVDIRAEETLFVDDASVNCIAAEELGIRTLMPEANTDWSEALREILK